MGKIRVLVVDDSALARDLLRGLLEADSDIEIVGEAANGEEAVQLATKLKPDLITMDLEMPVMGGMDTITEIMATQALPILVVSSVTDAKKAYTAVAHGALDVVNKPEFGDDAAGANLIAKVKMLSKIRVITHVRAITSAKKTSGTVLPPVTSPCSADNSRLFAIASSTGGPQALALLLGMLPAAFPCAILISQHISDGFAAGMAEWLAGVCKLPVRLAREGEEIMAGTVYISPSENNLTVTPAHRISLVPRLPGEIYHPTCDVMLTSVAAVYGKQGIGVILTGMGSDGAAGMEKIRQANGVTLAQDEASSVIFGMNKVAIERGSVQQVLPLQEISRAMCHFAGLAD
jgi:two-component system chemotaxis response regulator CheB